MHNAEFALCKLAAVLGTRLRDCESHGNPFVKIRDFATSSYTGEAGCAPTRFASSPKENATEFP